MSSRQRSLDAAGPSRKSSVASRKLSARMDSEISDAFRLFDKVSYVLNTGRGFYNYVCFVIEEFSCHQCICNAFTILTFCKLS